MSGKALFRTLAVPGRLCAASSAADRPSQDAGDRLRTGLTDAQRKLLGVAEQRLIAACTRDQGFRYRLEPDVPGRGLEAPERRFGLDDGAWARRHGSGGT